MDVKERFWQRVEKQESGCWLWKGKLDSQGYSRFMIDGRSLRGHQAALILFRGLEIRKGFHTHHTCSNISCVNPDHLEVMTSVEHRRLHVGETCTHGHPRDEANTYYRRRDRWMVRECRVCRRLAAGTLGPKKPQYWTRERVIEAIRKWAAEHDGKPPRSSDWLVSKAIKGDYPSFGAVCGRDRGAWKRPFSLWSDAVEAAGFPRPERGRHMRKESSHT